LLYFRKKYQKQTNANLNTAFFLANLQFADWDTEDFRGFAIPGLSLKISGFANFRFADWHTSEICGIAIAE
jgi:hypothetical protein